MKKKKLLQQVFVISMALFLIVSCKKTATDKVATNVPAVDEYKINETDETPLWIAKSNTTVGASEGCVKVFASGLKNPRGLKFSPTGYLYVAEGGDGGGSDSTIGLCTQVPFPVGPYHGGPTGGRISRINLNGERTTVTDQLPSSRANEIIGGDVEGVGDVAFVDHVLYAVLAGAGCSHGVKSVPNGVIKVAQNGSKWEMIANVSNWLMSHPVKNPEPDDFEPDGTPYSMITVDGVFYVLEPNHGDLMKITTSGNISRVIDISATQGHIVPTALFHHDGNFYMGNLHPFPIVDGSSNIYKITPGGDIKVFEKGLTTVLGLTFDENGRMYILENTTGKPGLTPGTGKVIRINKLGKRSVIASGLSLPTAMTIGPDGNLYVSNWGFGPKSTAGGGEILQISVKKGDE